MSSFENQRLAPRNQGSWSQNAPPPPPPKQMDEEDEEKLRVMFKASFDELRNVGDLKEAKRDVADKIKSKNLPLYISFMLSEVTEINQREVEKTSKTIVDFLFSLSQVDLLHKKELEQGIREHMELIDDLRMDCPNIGKLTGHTIGGFIVQNMLQLGDLWPLVKNAGCKSDLYLSALSCVAAKRSTLSLLDWKSLGLSWEEILGRKHLDEIHEKLDDNGLGFLHAPLANKEVSELAEFIKGCKLRVKDRKVMKNFFIGYLSNVYLEKGRVTDDPNFDLLCDHMEAVKQVFDVTVETIVGLQAICCLTDSPNTKLFTALVDAAMATKSITHKTLCEFEGTDQPFIGTFATILSKFKNHSDRGEN